MSTSPGRLCSLSAIWFAIVAVGRKSRAILPEQLRDPLLQLVDGRILAHLLVADDGGGDRRAHPRRRAGDGVGAKIDHGRPFCTCGCAVVRSSR